MLIILHLAIYFHLRQILACLLCYCTQSFCKKLPDHGLPICSQMLQAAPQMAAAVLISFVNQAIGLIQQVDGAGTSEPIWKQHIAMAKPRSSQTSVRYVGKIWMDINIRGKREIKLLYCCCLRSRLRNFQTFQRTNYKNFDKYQAMNFIEQLINSQTTFCTHGCGCIISALKQAFKNLKYGLLISLALQLIRTLKTLAKNPSAVKHSLRGDYFTIALFLPAIVLTLKLVRCTLRRIRQKDDGLNSLLAGAAAGWVATKTLSKDYWYFYLTFIGSRLIGAVHKALIERGILNRQSTHWHCWAMMAFAHAVHSFGYFLHPYILKQDMYGLYEKMSALTPKEKRWHHAALVYSQRGLTRKYGPHAEFDAITAARITRLEARIRKDAEYASKHAHQ